MTNQTNQSREHSAIDPTRGKSALSTSAADNRRCYRERMLTSLSYQTARPIEVNRWEHHNTVFGRLCETVCRHAD